MPDFSLSVQGTHLTRKNSLSWNADYGIYQATESTADTFDNDHPYTEKKNQRKTLLVNSCFKKNRNVAKESIMTLLPELDSPPTESDLSNNCSQWSLLGPQPRNPDWYPQDSYLLPQPQKALTHDQLEVIFPPFRQISIKKTLLSTRKPAAKS
mmetsp:Transcript_33035/g.50622  ORF Transcript_33035/g.50622 Transcript_33035/m.50622 type:complete len:153 (+) Transcript_33035:482-940(+)